MDVEEILIIGFLILKKKRSQRSSGCTLYCKKGEQRERSKYLTKE
nr:unnamed protein product [Callosobruchus chinensis]